MNIAVIGAGSQGSTYGGWLTLAGFDVWFITRRKEHADKLQEKGLLLEGIDGKKLVRVKATNRLRDLPNFDLVCIFVKTYDTQSASKTIQKIVNPKTSVLTLQNGLGNVEILEKKIDRGNILAGVSWAGTKRISDTHVIYGEFTKTVIGELDGKISERLRKIVHTFKSSGIETIASKNIMSDIWYKLATNAVNNPIGAITNMNFSQMAKSESISKIVRFLIEEIKLVAKTQKVNFSEVGFLRFIKEDWQMLPNHTVSMKQDLEKGKKTEIDSINGAIVRLGRKHGIATPYNEILTLLVKSLEETEVLKKEQVKPEGLI